MDDSDDDLQYDCIIIGAGPLMNNTSPPSLLINQKDSMA